MNEESVIGDEQAPRVLVTGAAGFIGSHVARHCLALGHEVVAVDDLSGGFEHNVPHGAKFRKGSVIDVGFVEDLFRDGSFDYVYHLAAYAAEGLSHFIRRFNYTNNVIGSVVLINAAVRHRIRRFVFTSSIAVYGTNQLPMTETMTPLPEDPYGIAKYAIELDLRAAHDIFGLEYTVFRPHNVYGERQNIGDRYRNVVGIFMNQLMQGRPMTIFGDGSQTRAFSHIDEVAPLIARSTNMPEAANEVFNVGADERTTIRELATLIADAFDIAPQFAFMPARREVVHAFAGHDKARSVFGRPNPISLPVGLSRMADWAREVGPQASPAVAELEVADGVPAAWQDDTTGPAE